MKIDHWRTVKNKILHTILGPLGLAFLVLRLTPSMIVSRRTLLAFFCWGLLLNMCFGSGKNGGALETYQ